MELDTNLMRKYSGQILMGFTLDDAKNGGFVLDENDVAMWNLAMEDPESWTGGEPVSEVPISVMDMSVVDDIVARLAAR